MYNGRSISFFEELKISSEHWIPLDYQIKTDSDLTCQILLDIPNGRVNVDILEKELPSEHSGKCQLCSTGIKERFAIVSEGDRRLYAIVGKDCITNFVRQDFKSNLDKRKSASVKEILKKTEDDAKNFILECNRRIIGALARKISAFPVDGQQLKSFMLGYFTSIARVEEVLKLKNYSSEDYLVAMNDLEDYVGEVNGLAPAAKDCLSEFLKDGLDTSAFIDKTLDKIELPLTHYVGEAVLKSQKFSDMQFEDTFYKILKSAQMIFVENVIIEVSSDRSAQSIVNKAVKTEDMSVFNKMLAKSGEIEESASRSCFRSAAIKSMPSWIKMFEEGFAQYLTESKTISEDLKTEALVELEAFKANAINAVNDLDGREFKKIVQNKKSFSEPEFKSVYLRLLTNARSSVFRKKAQA